MIDFCGGIAPLRAARWLFAIALFCSWLFADPKYIAAQGASEATSSREAREEVLRRLSKAELSREDRAKVNGILGATTIYRRLPSQMIECDPHLYVFLVEHPDLVVNIWEALGISEVQVEQIGEGLYSANDKAGTVGRMQFLHASPDMHVVYAEGSYEGPLFGRPIKGQSLLVLETRYFRNTSGRHFIRCRMDAFLHVENVGVGVLAKTLQPLVGAAADHNFRETTAFLAGVSRAAEVNYAGMQRMAEKLNRVAEADREQFASLTEQLAIRAALAQTAQQPQRVAADGKSASPRPAASTTRRPARSMKQR
jgi:hypothetical protein